mmetsp:Transcript_10907/g.11046  ORF Transcript_10907/g.11046 Transcript_10907/m.11046 type:complete len:103 (-) Transcript_10907:315-623(-)
MKELSKAKVEQDMKLRPKGNDMLGQLFVRKRHQSYERREINDKQLEWIQTHFVDDGNRRFQQFDRNNEAYRQMRNEAQKQEEEQKLKEWKKKELETKQFQEA